MNVNENIIAALSPLGYPVEPSIYTGKSDKYFRFNYVDDRGEVFADDTPQIDRAYLQIHFFCPQSFNYMTLKKQARSKLFKAGFSYPSIAETDENDTGKHHIIFETDIDGESETEE